MLLMIDSSRDLIMSFKGIVCFQICLSILIGTSCQRFFEGESSRNTSSEPPKISVASGEGSCSQGFQGRLVRYLDSQLSEPEIEAFWHCLATTVRLVEKNAHGGQGSLDQYRAIDLQKFFNEYLFFDYRLNRSKFVMSTDFAQSIMAIKVALFGGHADYFTRTELHLLADFLDILAKETVLLNDYWPVILLQPRASEMVAKDIHYFVKARAALRDSLPRVLEFLKPHQGRFQVGTISQFLLELGLFLKRENPRDWSDVFERWLPLVETLQAILTESNRNILGPDDWSVLSNGMGEDLYSIVIAARFPLAIFPKTTLEGLKVMDETMEAAVRVVDRIHAQRRGGVISFIELDSVIEAFLKVDQQKNIKVDPLFITGAVKPMLRNIFAYWESTKVNEVLGLRQVHVRRLMGIYQSWSEVQKKIIRTAAVPGLLESFLTFEDFRRGFFGDSQPQSQAKMMNQLSLGDRLFLESLPRGQSVHLDSNGIRIIDYPSAFVKNPYLIKQNQPLGLADAGALFQINWARSLVQMLVQGFSKDMRRAELVIGLTVSEFAEFESMFERLAIELKVFDPRSGSRASRILIEADLFSRFGNGDGQLQFAEALDLLLNNYTYGTVLFGKIYEELAVTEKCEIAGSKDVLNEVRLDRDCVERNQSKVFLKYMESLPTLKLYLSLLEPEKRELYFKTLLRISHSKLACQDSYETSTIQQMVVVLSYLESMMTRFDKNENGLLDLAEAVDAFPLFKTMIGGLTAPGTSDANLLRGFLYLVEYQSLPQVGSFWGKGKFFIDRSWNQLIQSFESPDREKLLNIFAIVFDRLATSGPPLSHADWPQSAVCLSDAN